MPFATCVGHGTVGVCDLGIPNCCSHGRCGTNAQGSVIFEIEGQPVHLLSHTGPTNCPHGGTFVSVEGARLIESEELPVTLVGHTTACLVCGKTGTHSGGSELLEIDG